MRSGRFCEIPKPRRNGFVRRRRTYDKLAQAQLTGDRAVAARSRQLKSVADAAYMVRRGRF